MKVERVFIFLSFLSIFICDKGGKMHVCCLETQLLQSSLQADVLTKKYYTQAEWRTSQRGLDGL